MRTRAHKLTLELDSGAGELYDLAHDPEEMDNRFDDPAFAAIRCDLADMIASRPADLAKSLPRAGDGVARGKRSQEIASLVAPYPSGRSPIPMFWSMRRPPRALDFSVVLTQVVPTAIDEDGKWLNRLPRAVGLVGLGAMGRGVAANLIAEGHCVVGFDIRPEMSTWLIERGGTFAANFSAPLASAAYNAFLAVSGRGMVGGTIPP